MEFSLHLNVIFICFITTVDNKNEVKNIEFTLNSIVWTGLLKKWIKLYVHVQRQGDTKNYNYRRKNFSQFLLMNTKITNKRKRCAWLKKCRSWD